MAIEVTSFPDQGRTLSIRRIARILSSFQKSSPSKNDGLVIRLLPVLLATIVIAGADSLVRSYKYHSRIIDARIAGGYQHTRPGLYAAPRQISAGDKISRQQLISILRRAGYVAFPGGNAWNGNYREAGNDIEIRTAARSGPHSVVKVEFAGSEISRLDADGLPLESLTLDPEVLSNDLSFKASQRQPVTFSEIPSPLIHAILAIEDQRFFDHHGLDPIGFARALLRNASEDRISQGGSTITQQLVKNTYLTRERTLKRKYAEAMLALALERRLSKEEIFALYCNEVYLGQRGAVAIRGVHEAAGVYFGKDLMDLTLAEAATLAGMIQSPTLYSPALHPNAAMERRNVVLEAMARDGRISSAQAESISKQPITLAPQSVQKSLAPYFVDYVNRTLDSQLEPSGANQRIYTTLDVELQQLAEKAIDKQLAKLDVVYKNRNLRPQAALVALDPRTGHVLAMVGGRDYAASQLNRATDARRQPGSTFKPFVYAAALEDGMSPVRTFTDAPRDFVYDNSRVYRPANFGSTYSMRDVTMRDGLVRSLNVVTVDVAMQTGLARIARLAESAGLPRPERYPSMALGAGEVTPLELAAAYAVFANGGRRVDPKVVTSVGSPPAAHALAGEQPEVVSPTTGYMITNMLSAVIDHGTARTARDIAKHTAVAGKTGTSRDGWFVGYTPNLVCVVWIGFDDNGQLGLTGAEAALPAWTDFITGAVALRPELGGKSFECPEGIKFVEIDAEMGLISTLTCPHREVIAVTERLAPNLECLTHGNLPVMESDPPNDGVESTGPVPAAPLIASRVVRGKTTATYVEVDKRGRRTLVNDIR